MRPTFAGSVCVVSRVTKSWVAKSQVAKSRSQSHGSQSHGSQSHGSQSLNGVSAPARLYFHPVQTTHGGSLLEIYERVFVFVFLCLRITKIWIVETRVAKSQWCFRAGSIIFSPRPDHPWWKTPGNPRMCVFSFIFFLLSSVFVLCICNTRIAKPPIAQTPIAKSQWCFRVGSIYIFWPSGPPMVVSPENPRTCVLGFVIDRLNQNSLSRGCAYLNVD